MAANGRIWNLLEGMGLIGVSGCEHLLALTGGCRYNCADQLGPMMSMNPIAYIPYVGVLRVMLHGFSLVVIVFFVLLLDMMMAMVFMVDRTGEIRRRYRAITLIDLALVITLFFPWLQYFITIGNSDCAGRALARHPSAC